MGYQFESEFSPEMRDRAYYLRFSTIENLESHLLALESNLAKNFNTEVRWAEDEGSLCDQIVELLPKSSYNKVCFDLPHIPENLLHTDHTLSVVSVEDFSSFQNEADVLVLNADFAIADNGSLVFIEKKSKDCFNYVSNVIVIVPIDQIIPYASNLSLFLRLKSRNASGSPNDVKIISSSFKKIISDQYHFSDSDGFSTLPVHISVIFYENYVSQILQDVALRQSLYCIHCGRCLEVCPVTQKEDRISPIDIVKSNCFDKYNHTQSIFQQTTLCGNCEEVCPMHIPLTELLSYEMNLVNANVNNARSNKLFSLFSKRSKLNKYNSPILRWYFVHRFFGKNKMLSEYYSNQKGTFYNILRNRPEKEDDE